MIATSLRAFAFFTVLTGLAYPIAMTAFAHRVFHEKASGSIIFKNGAAVGSSLIAQKFESAGHFHSRPSAVDYNPLPSGGSNLGPTSADLKAKVEERRKAGMDGDMLFASGSGLDPEISPESAELQATRIAESRGLPTQQVMALVNRTTEWRQLGVLGEPRVNVLRLNLALDQLATENSGRKK